MGIRMKSNFYQFNIEIIEREPLIAGSYWYRMFKRNFVFNTSIYKYRMCSIPNKIGVYL